MNKRIPSSLFALAAVCAAGASTAAVVRAAQSGAAAGRIAAAAVVVAPTASSKAEIDKPVRDFALVNVAADKPGQVVKLSDYKGKKNVVLVWMSYQCPVTRQYEERLGKLVQKYGAPSSDVQFVAVHANSPEKNDRIRRYAQDKNFTGPVLDDKAQVPGMTEYFGARATPTVVILDKKGVMRFKGRIDSKPEDERGVDPETKPFVVPALLAIKQGRDVVVKTSPTPG